MPNEPTLVDNELIPVEVDVESTPILVDSELAVVEVEVDRLVSSLLVVLRPVDSETIPVDVDVDRESIPVDSELAVVEVDSTGSARSLFVVLRPVMDTSWPSSRSSRQAGVDRCSVVLRPVGQGAGRRRGRRRQTVTLLFVVLRPVDSELTPVDRESDTSSTD